VNAVARLDRYQRRHSWLGFPLAVIYKFFDDRGSYLSALITYYAFVSLFPLLLLFYSALGFFLEGHPEVQHDLEQSVLQNFPVIGPELSKNITSFQGSGVALAVGILGALYGGLGAMQAAQAGFNQIYGVPRNRQPNPIKSRLRSLGLLGLLGTGVLLSTAIAVIVATANGISAQFGPVTQVAGYVLSYLVNVALFSAAFQLLTSLDLRFRQVLAGGMVAAGLWLLVQTFGAKYIGHVLKHSNHLYGVFAVVLTALAWIYLQSVILMLSAEINVVLHRRLWPRSLLTPFTDDVILTAADRRAYEQYAKTQRFKGFETVTAEFEPPEVSAGGDGGHPGGQRSEAPPPGYHGTMDSTVPKPGEPTTPVVPDAPVSPAVPDPGTPADPEEPATVPAPEEPATPAVPEPRPEPDGDT
jgi:YihY family inner membrane protein